MNTIWDSFKTEKLNQGFFRKNCLETEGSFPNTFALWAKIQILKDEVIKKKEFEKTPILRDLQFIIEYSLSCYFIQEFNMDIPMKNEVDIKNIIPIDEIETRSEELLKKNNFQLEELNFRPF